MKTRKITALILIAIAIVTLSFTFSTRPLKDSKSIDKSNAQTSQPQQGFVSESKI